MTTQAFSLPRGKPDRFYPRWIVANALSETLGLGLVALIVVWLMPRLETGLTLLLVLTLFAATLLEGLCVGVAQWLVLREKLAFKPWHWVGVTMLGGAVAWLIGMAAGTSFSPEAESTAATSEPSRLVVLALAAVMGLALGALLGGAQWFVLRRFVNRSGLWLIANALAWAVGMPLIFVSIDFLAVLPPGLWVVALGMLCLFVVGAVVGAVHGLFLLHLLNHQRERSRPTL